jgi:hypothetical protein
MARFRGVAQPGSALRSGRRGPQFESGHPDLPSLPRSLLVLFACAAVLLAAGCGGGSSSHHRLSAVAFRNRANHICSDLSRQAKASAGSTSKADVDKSFARIDAAVGRLEDLNPPTLYAQRYQELLTNFKQIVDFVRENRDRLIQMSNRLNSHPSDKRTAQRLQQLIRPFEQKLQRAASDARGIGLPDCANGFTSSSTG